MAVYDKENNKFESICRLLSLTDEMYKSKTEFYQNRLLESLSDRDSRLANALSAASDDIDVFPELLTRASSRTVTADRPIAEEAV